MRRYLKQLKPTEFEDITAMVSLYRPGPMEKIPEYIKCKHGEKEVKYLHPDLAQILKPTYGVGIYQEQILEMARVFAGFTLGEADLLRRAIGKKIKSELDAQREKFIAIAYLMVTCLMALLALSLEGGEKALVFSITGILLLLFSIGLHLSLHPVRETHR
jgi:predicted Kef-type K+ transport protein